MPALTNCTSWLSTRCRHWLRIGAYIVLGIAGVALAALLVHKAFFPLIAWAIPTTRPFFYDLLVFGAYPTSSFVSFDLNPPKGAFTRWNSSCDNGDMYLGTDGKSVGQKGPVILDARGELIWMSDEFDVVMNLRVQHYRGDDYLTFWAGHKKGTVGRGEGYMLDSAYRVAHRVQAVGHGLHADLHEFQLTDQGTALITIYNVTTADLRPMGWGRPKEGWIEDCLFQEIDVATGELLFQWRAQDYFHAEDSYYWHPFGGYTKAMPFDFYHINSIQKDSKGNYLISSRHFHHVVYINGTSGDPLWILGGHSELNRFSDLSDGAATGFQWQHHARWFSEEDSIISLLDNGIAGPLHVDAPYSKGLLIHLNTNNYSAAVVQRYISSTKAQSAAMGSVAQLPSGNMLLGWGSSAAFSEHAPDGTLLCEWHFAASWSFWWERAKNYRAFKYQGWVGKPDYPPSVKVQDGRIYVSWNGATEVKFWELQGSKRGDSKDRKDPDFIKIEELEKLAFEEWFLLPASWDVSAVRIAALDRRRQVLGYSEPVRLGTGNGSSFAIIMGVSAAVAALAGGFCLLRVCTRRKDGRFSAWDHGTSFFRREYRYSKL